jgi:hypothetical protein
MIRPRTTGRTVTAGLLCLAALWNTPLPAQAQTAPVSGVVFNDPNDPVKMRAVSNKFKALIGAADAGSWVRIVMFEFHDATIKDALKAAKQRGVNVQIIADYESRRYANGTVNDTWTQLVNLFGTNKSAPSWVMTCPMNSACIGSGDIMHNKFALFSSSGGKKVVFQSSSNLYRGSVGGGDGNWNNAVAIVGDVGRTAGAGGPATLYDSYFRYFGDLKNLRRTNNQYDKYQDSGNEYGKFKPYYFPRSGTDASTDTIMSVLKNVDCTRRDNATTGTSMHQTIVRVAMAYFTRREIADKLQSMDNAGCYVEVVYRKDSVGDYVDRVLDDQTGPYNGIRSWYFQDAEANSLHSKYLAIEGNYVGAKDMKLVWTGSHNYTYPALRGNDETLLRIFDNDVHDAFRQNFWNLVSAPGVVRNL